MRTISPAVARRCTDAASGTESLSKGIGTSDRLKRRPEIVPADRTRIAGSSNHSEEQSGIAESDTAITTTAHLLSPLTYRTLVSEDTSDAGIWSRALLQQECEWHHVPGSSVFIATLSLASDDQEGAEAL